MNLQQLSTGVTALWQASQEGHVDVVKALLTNDNVDVHLQRTTDGTTALYIASQKGILEVVKALLANDMLPTTESMLSTTESMRPMNESIIWQKGWTVP